MNNKVAVVGISCIVPGAKKHNELWDNLINKRESITYIKNSDSENEQWTHINVSGCIEDFEGRPIPGIDEHLIP